MAKKFTFRLEPVLKLKTHKVQIALDSLNQAVRLRNEKEQMIIMQSDNRSNLIDLGVKSNKAGDIQAIFHHRDFIDNEIKKLEEEKKRIIEIENIRRTKLTNAMKEEKVLEKLKEKKQIIHQDEINKEEGKFLDEIAINTHINPNLI